MKIRLLETAGFNKNNVPRESVKAITQVISPKEYTDLAEAQKDEYVLGQEGTATIKNTESEFPFVEDGAVLKASMANQMLENTTVDFLWKGATGYFKAETEKELWFTITFGSNIETEGVYAYTEILELKLKEGQENVVEIYQDFSDKENGHDMIFQGPINETTTFGEASLINPDFPEYEVEIYTQYISEGGEITFKKSNIFFPVILEFSKWIREYRKVSTTKTIFGVESIEDFYRKTHFKYGKEILYLETNGENITKTSFKQTFKLENVKILQKAEAAIIESYPLIDTIEKTFWTVTKKEYIDNNTVKLHFELNALNSFGLRYIKEENRMPLERAHYEAYFETDDDILDIKQTYSDFTTKHSSWRIHDAENADNASDDTWIQITYKLLDEMTPDYTPNGLPIPYKTFYRPLSANGINTPDGEHHYFASNVELIELMKDANLISLQLINGRPFNFLYVSHTYIDANTTESIEKLLMPDSTSMWGFSFPNNWYMDRSFLISLSHEDNIIEKPVWGIPNTEEESEYEDPTSEIDIENYTKWEYGNELFYRAFPFTTYEFRHWQEAPLSQPVFSISDSRYAREWRVPSFSDTIVSRQLYDKPSNPTDPLSDMKIIQTRRDGTLPQLTSEWEEYQQTKKSNFLNNTFKPIINGAITGAAGGTLVAPGAGTITGGAAGAAAGLGKAVMNGFFRKQTIKDQPLTEQAGSQEALSQLFLYESPYSLWVHEPIDADKEKIAFAFHKYGAYRDGQISNIFTEMKRRERFNFLKADISDYRDIFRDNIDKEIIAELINELNTGVWFWDTATNLRTINFINNLPNENYDFFNFDYHNGLLKEWAIRYEKPKRKEPIKLSKKQKKEYKKATKIYVANPPVLQEIPAEEKYDINDLVVILKELRGEENGKKTKRNKSFRKK